MGLAAALRKLVAAVSAYGREVELSRDVLADSMSSENVLRELDEEERRVAASTEPPAGAALRGSG